MVQSDIAQTNHSSVALIDGSSRTVFTVQHFPFTIGRSLHSDLVLPHPLVSRCHAEITQEGSSYFLEDAGSRHGTFINGERVVRRLLHPQDRLSFGSLSGAELRFTDADSRESMHRNLLSQVQDLSIGRSDLEKLRWLLEAARDLNNADQTECVLTSLLHATLRLAPVERGFVLLANPAGALEFALGLDAMGNRIQQPPVLSQTAIRQAVVGREQFLLTDTGCTDDGPLPDSMLVNQIRTVICIPLQRQRPLADRPCAPRLIGMLYLDSRLHPKCFSDTDHDLLRTIACEAAALLDIAQLSAIEEKARLHEQELSIAAGIQQSLMAIQIPALPFARIEAHSLPCSAVGGDFFDVLSTDETLSVALVDVSGKGVAAAILASTLQGMLHIQLKEEQPLQDIAAATNAYLCTRSITKYATMLLLRLHRDGTLEYINCGHIQPRLCAGALVHRLEGTNLPVGLFPQTEFLSATTRLEPGWSVTLASDGFTEAEDSAGDSFGEDRFDAAARCGELKSVIEQMKTFCADHPTGDDCTVVQVTFTA